MNNRPIKFRAYNKKSKEMLDVVKIEYAVRKEFIPTGNLTEEDVTFIFFADGSFVNLTNCILCQHIGRKDKHGHELHEHDIVRFSTTISEGIDQIIWDENNCCFTTTKHGRHVLDKETEFEVLGNVFENAELLIY